MKFIKIALVFGFVHLALPTCYCITLPKMEQDSIKQKRKISNKKVLDMFEVVQGVTSFGGGIAIFWLGNKLIRTNLALNISIGKFFMVLGVTSFIIGVLLLIHFFLRHRKKKKMS